MGIPGANTNARNDLCVGEMKVSGSAYKIAGTRAYHHGTMLIATRLDALGEALRNDKVRVFASRISYCTSTAADQSRDQGRGERALACLQPAPVERRRVP